MFSIIGHRPLGVLLLSGTVALAACASEPEAPTFAERVAAEGGEVVRIADEWAEGDAMISAGRELVEEGEDEIEAGEKRARQGRRQISRGEKMIRQGSELKRQAEETYADRQAASAGVTSTN